MESKEKIILQSPYYAGGVDKSIIDFDITSSVKVLVTTVVVPIYKEGSKAYIGTKDGFLPQEVIQVGNLGILYKTIGPIKKLLPEGGYLHRIKRADGYNITLMDINAVSVGDRVKIKSRKSFDQLMNYDGVFSKQK